MTQYSIEIPLCNTCTPKNPPVCQWHPAPPPLLLLPPFPVFLFLRVTNYLSFRNNELYFIFWLTNLRNNEPYIVFRLLNLGNNKPYFNFRQLDLRNNEPYFFVGLTNIRNNESNFFSRLTNLQSNEPTE